MKKALKNLVACALSVALACMGLAPAAWAEGSISNSSEHSFKAYQVFTGTAGGDVLYVTGWGEGIDSSSFLTALQSDSTLGETFSDCTSAIAVAKKLAEFDAGSSSAQAFANLAAKYVVEKEGQSIAAGSNASPVTTSLSDGYWLIVDDTTPGTGDAYSATILQLMSGSKIDFTGKITVPTIEKYVNEKDQATSASIGDTVTFTLKGKVPSDMSYYSTYYYQFSDTLSAGLTYKGNVKVCGVTSGGDETDITSSFETATTEADDSCTLLTITCTNLKEVSDIDNYESIKVTYDTTLNSNAVIGPNGNPNTVKLIYSNNPQAATETSGEGAPTNTGETVEVQAIVYTFQLVITKLDGEGQELTGAGFTLYKKSGEEYVKVSAIAADASTSTFTFTGLGAGNYKISETETPTGYKAADDITFTIEADYNGSALKSLTSVDGSVSVDADTGIFSVTIVNYKGIALPTTGDIGTTWFYTIGALLMLAGAVVLVALRRMRRYQE